MKVMLLADGTVPVLAAKVVMMDGDLDGQDCVATASELGELDVRFFSVESGSGWLGVSWVDGEGFSVSALDSEELAWDYLETDQRSFRRISRVGPGHYVATHEWPVIGSDGYFHIFRVNY